MQKKWLGIYVFFPEWRRSVAYLNPPSLQTNGSSASDIGWGDVTATNNHTDTRKR